MEQHVGECVDSRVNVNRHLLLCSVTVECYGVYEMYSTSQ